MVAGYTCEWYVMGEKSEAEVCAATGLGMFMYGQSPMGRSESSMSALATLGANADYVKMFKNGFFPLKMAQNERGRKRVVMEATKVEKKSLDASLFVPPPDYTEMKMPGFWTVETKKAGPPEPDRRQASTLITTRRICARPGSILIALPRAHAGRQNAFAAVSVSRRWALRCRPASRIASTFSTTLTGRPSGSNSFRWRKRNSNAFGLS
jgi:hypothetical protein